MVSRRVRDYPEFLPDSPGPPHMPQRPKPTAPEPNPPPGGKAKPAPRSARSVRTDSPNLSECPTLDATVGLPALSTAPSLVGQTIGDFQILEEIGRGGMG